MHSLASAACRWRYACRILVLAFVCGLGGSLAAGAQQTGQTLPQFVAALQRAVAADNRPAVAALMRYPLIVRAGKLQIPVADADAFLGLYESIVTPGLKDVLARARVPASGQAPGIFRTPEGGVVIDHAITITPTSPTGGNTFAVTAIDVPPGGPATNTGTATATAGAKAGAERRLTFRTGRPTQISGTLMTGGSDRFTFAAQQGTFVDLRIEGVPGRTVLLRLLDNETGKPVDARADTGTRVWNGRLPASTTYRVEVNRQPGTGSEPLIYTLTATLK